MPRSLDQNSTKKWTIWRVERPCVSVCNSDARMETRGSMVEVLGVPDVLPADRIADKLQIYFLRPRYGGGEVREVLYPCFQPGQAFITFEDPEVAARVLRKSSHVLELNNQQYHLTVKAVDHLQMDFPVEATVHLNVFPNKMKARKILSSYGFELTDLNSDQVRVRGSFLKLRTAKAFLEPLVSSQTKTSIMPSSSSPVPNAYSISKHYYSSDGNQGRLGSLNKAPRTDSGSSNNHTTSPQYSSSFSPRPDQHCSFRAGKESFAIDADVFDYADELRKKEINGILESHNVEMKVSPLGNSYSLTLQGKSTHIAVNKLQSLLTDLSKSLRTQEVPLKEMSREGKALLKTIQNNRNIYNSVLVCPKNDRLHLIGPSGESYQLKQTLLGRPVDQSGRTGRTLDKNSRRRSSSLPPIHLKNTERDHGAVANPSPARAAGYSPAKYQDVNLDAAEPKQRTSYFHRLLRRRSQSEPRKKTTTERTNGNMQEVANKHRPPQFSKKSLLQKLTSDNIKQTFKIKRK